MLGLIHNRGIVKYFLTFVGIVIALYFAWNFYPFGEWSGKQFLQDVPGGPQMLGYICAIIMGVLVLIALFHKEYMKEDVEEYSKSKGDESFTWALRLFIWAIIALELFSVGFRVYLLNWSKVGWILLGVGLVGMGLTWIIGKVLHAQVNRPWDVEAGRMMNDAGNTVLQRGRKDWGKLDSDDLRQVADGNFKPLNKFNDWQARRKASKASVKEAGHQKWLAEKVKKEQAAKDFLKPRTDDPADFLSPNSSNNGHF